MKKLSLLKGARKMRFLTCAELLFSKNYGVPHGHNRLGRGGQSWHYALDLYVNLLRCFLGSITYKCPKWNLALLLIPNNISGQLTDRRTDQGWTKHALCASLPVQAWEATRQKPSWAKKLNLSWASQASTERGHHYQLPSSGEILN